MEELKSKTSSFNNNTWIALFLIVLILSFVLSSSLLERMAVFFELLCIWLLVKENKWTFPIGMVSTVLFFFLFSENGLYGSMLLQVYFFIMNIVGWKLWSNSEGVQEDKKTRHLQKKGIILYSSTVLVVPLLLYYLLQRTTDMTVLYLDCLVTVLCIIGSILTSFKVLENWYVWILCEVIYLFLYGQHGLYLAVFTSLITTLLNVKGLVSWKANMASSVKESHIRYRAITPPSLKLKSAKHSQENK